MAVTGMDRELVFGQQPTAVPCLQDRRSLDDLLLRCQLRVRRVPELLQEDHRDGSSQKALEEVKENSGPVPQRLREDLREADPLRLHERLDGALGAVPGGFERRQRTPADAPDGIEPGGDGMRLGPGLIHEEGVDRELGRVVPRRRERQSAGLLEEPVGFPAADTRCATVDEDVRQEPAEAAAARVDQRNPEAIVALRTPAPLRVLGIKRSHPQRVGTLP